MEGLHTHDGLYFQRNGDGSVTVAATGPNVVRLTPEDWASTVAYLTKEGGTETAIHDAYVAQTGESPGASRAA